MKTSRPDLKDLKTQAYAALAQARRFSVVMFLGLVAILYGFVFLRVNTLNGTEPSQASIDEQVQAAQVPHIDESTVRQLESLQNNSVNVQALFNEARSNPFE
jgi:hypothetical protein